MHVGYNAAFQNPHDALDDEVVYEHELRLCDLAVELGFESLWTVEHHFDDYTMCPDPVQWLSYMAGKHPNVLLGSGVVVLPWHDPLRVAEQVALLDHVSGGRMILGIGRGLARIEYDGFRVDMNTSRERFVEYARLVTDALETGYMEYDNEFGTQPRRQIRPRPAHSFRGRTYAAAVSPESMPLMAGLGIGVLVIPQKPWPTVQQDLADVRAGLSRGQRQRAAAPDLGRVRVLRRERRPGRGDGAQVDRRELRLGDAPLRVRRRTRTHGVKGYEFYTGITRYVERHGAQGRDRRLRQPHAVGHARPGPRQVRAHAHDDRDERDAARLQLRRHALRRWPSAACACSPRRCSPSCGVGPHHHCRCRCTSAPAPEERTMIEISAQAQALLGSDAVAHVWTNNPDGTPQVSVVWLIARGDEILFGTDARSQKARNLARDDRIVLSIEDVERNERGFQRHLVLRGSATIDPGPDPLLMDQLARKYLGLDRHPLALRDSPSSVVVRVAIERISGVGPWIDA